MGKTSSSIHNINYHVVFCPKYRKPVLKGAVKEFVEDTLKTTAEAKGFKILELRVMPDHVHLFVSAPPQFSPTAIVKMFKGITALRTFEKFPKVKKELWGGHLWSPSYYIGTAGHVSAETIQKYIEGNLNSSTV